MTTSSSYYNANNQTPIQVQTENQLIAAAQANMTSNVNAAAASAAAAAASALSVNAANLLQRSNNLSDLSIPATARTNLGLAAVAASGSATDLTTGTLNAALLPNPAPTTLGGVKSLAAVTHKFLTQIGTDGSVSQAQPAASDITGLAAVATSGSATDLTTGTLNAARLPNPSASTLGGVQSSTAAANQFATGINTSGVVTYGDGGAFGTATVNFGSYPGADSASIAVSDTGVQAGSVITAEVSYSATADHSADEHLVENLIVQAGSISANVGFTIYVQTSSAWPLAYGQFNIAWHRR